VRAATTGVLSPARWRATVRRDWDRAAASWERFEPQFMYSIGSVDPALLRSLEPRRGDRVLDVGCGTGDPTLLFAQLVAPGRVLGLDPSPGMLAVARRRARHRGVTNVRFQVGDAARLRTGRRFDGAVSRYGLMFVDDLPRALARIRAVLARGGRAAFAVWGPAERNPFFRIRAEAVRPFVKEPPADLERTPNPLRLARPGRLAGLMREAGFRRVRSEGVQAPFTYGGVDQYLEMNLGAPSPLRDVYLRLGRRDQKRLRDRLARGIRPFQDGPLIRAPGFAWVVSGSR
jgi:ubiquinone/menaquinone biosynthesis C-methylase UbiE